MYAVPFSAYMVPLLTLDGEVGSFTWSWPGVVTVMLPRNAFSS